jgi:hypothetical protein
MYLIKPLKGILSIPTHAFAIYVQITIFATLHMIVLRGTW